MDDEKTSRARVKHKPAGAPDQAEAPRAWLVLPEDHRDSYEAHLRFQLKRCLDDWQRHHAVLLGKTEPLPGDVDRGWRRGRANWVGDPDPYDRIEEDDRGIIRWHFWRGIAEALQIQVEMHRLSFPVTLETPYEEILDDLSSFAADFILGLMEGHIPKFIEDKN